MEHQRRDFKSVPMIEPSKIFANDTEGSKRLILVDWEGTLWSEDPRVGTCDFAFAGRIYSDLV